MDDSGPAFPEVGNSCSGLTKREYFAAMAMQAFISTLGGDVVDSYDGEPKAAEEHHIAVAKWAYGYADAMLAEGRK